MDTGPKGRGGAPGDAGGSDRPSARPPAPGLPGAEAVALGGAIRHLPEDFLVEEIPLSRPAGRGSLVLCQVEKRGMSTFDMLLRISKGVKVSEHAIGYAGLKDSRAVTSQYLTVPKVPPERVLALEHPQLRVLSAARHDRPLKIGHHRGNRFRIRIRGVDPARIPAARRALETVSRRGLPNAYGEQRFGVRGNGHLLGRAVVDEDWPAFFTLLLGTPSDAEYNPRVREARRAYEEGDLEQAFRLWPLRHRIEKRALSALGRHASPREAFLSLGRRPRKIWASAWQSHVFNEVLSRRVLEDSYDRLLEGDVAWLHESSATYHVKDEAAEAGRASRLEASPTGPLVGFDLHRASGRAGAIEEETFRRVGVECEAFRAQHVRARGTRRPLRVPVHEASLEQEDEHTVRIGFVLPPGAFATVLLDLLMRGPGVRPPRPGGPAV